MCTNCEELEEQVRQLQRQLYGTDWEPPAELRLTRCERAILAALVASKHFVDEDTLLEATRFALKKFGEDRPATPLVKVFICKLRAKLAPFGLTIENDWGMGYGVSKETRRRLLHWKPRRAA